MSSQGSQRGRLNLSPSAMPSMMRPMKAVKPFSLKGSPTRKSPVCSPTPIAIGHRNSPERKSPISPSFKVEKPRAVRSNGSPSLRRAGSLEAIYNSYLSGKWPTPEVLSHFMVDQTTQTPDDWEINSQQKTKKKKKSHGRSASFGQGDHVANAKNIHYIKHRLQKTKEGSRQNGKQSPVPGNHQALSSTAPAALQGLQRASKPQGIPNHIPKSSNLSRYQRNSVEGLNTEIEKLVLHSREEELDRVCSPDTLNLISILSQYAYDIPDGHKAPCPELVNRGSSTRSIDTQTPGTGNLSDNSSGSRSHSVSPAIPIIPGHMDSSRPSSESSPRRPSSDSSPRRPSSEYSPREMEKDGTVQWYDAVNLCKQQGQILHPEITSNESSFGYRQDTTMWTSSYILSVNHVKHTALYVEQIPVTELHRGLCIDKKNSDKLIVLNIPLNYSQQDFICSWDYQRRYPDTLLNITNLGVVRRVLGIMDFGQKYWLSNISESVYKLVHQCEVFQYVANSTSIRKSYTAMRFCDEMNSYKCVDGKKYRPAVSLVKYLHDRHGNYHDRERTNNSGGFLHVSIIGALGIIILIGFTVTCVIMKRSIGNLKQEVQRLKQQRFEHPMYGTDQIQMIQSSVPEPETPISPTGSSMYENFLNSVTSGESNVTVSYLTSTQVQRTVEVTETHNATSQDYSDGFSPHFLPPLKIPKHRPIIRHTSLVNGTDGQVNMLHCRQTSTEPASSKMFPLQHCLRGMPVEWFKTEEDIHIHGSTNSTNKPSPRPCITNTESRVSSKSDRASAFYLNTGRSADFENPEIEIDGEDYENIWEKNI